MVAATNPVNPEKLGAVGKDHIAQCFAAAGAELETLRYKVVKGVTAGVPWIAETAFAWAPGAHGRCMTAGINWSPALKEDASPLRALLGYGHLLADQYCGPGEPVLLFMHLITPRVQFLDRGKSTVASETFGAMALQDAVIAVTKAWAKQREAERRDQKRDQRRRDALLRKRWVTVKDARWQVLPLAYAKASSDGAHPTSPRQIYYAARPRVLAQTAKVFTQPRPKGDSGPSRILWTRYPIRSRCGVHPCRAPGAKDILRGRGAAPSGAAERRCAVLDMAALVAAGKPKKLALTAALRKLVVINVMLRDTTPWRAPQSASPSKTVADRIAEH